MTPAEHNAARQPRLKAFLDRELSPWRRLAMRLHLARCAACREEMGAMRQIAEELRVQGATLDPLDPGLRSRILTTVRDITPQAAPPVQARRPVLIWGGALAALLLAAVVIPRFRTDYQGAALSGADTSQDRLASAPGAASQTAPQSPATMGGSMAQERTDTNGAGSVASPTTLSQGRAYDRQNLAYELSNSVTEPKSGVSAGSARRPKHVKVGVKSSLSQAAQQPIALARAGFDIDGYRFLARDGRRFAVPFHKNLEAVRFARAADGKMALAATSGPPVLYLAPTDVLHNDAVPGSRWQPLPAGSTSTQPLYVRPALDWGQFISMRWYPNMTVVGGLTYVASGELAFGRLPGSHIQIGSVLCPDAAAYRAYTDAHPAGLRLHAAHAGASK